MATYSIQKLSGSTDGKGIKVTGTSSAADVTLHTATSGAGDIDLVTLYAVNQDVDGETRSLTIAWGAETDPDNLMTVPVMASQGLILVCERLPIMNSLVIGAWADEANDVIVYGRVERVDN